MKKRRTRTGPSQGPDRPSLKVLFWNAGGLTQDKFSELKNIIFKEDADAIGIVECGASSDNIEFFKLKGYQSFTLKRSRQIASGIIIYSKSSLIAKANTRHSMTVSDKLEAVELQLWKGNMCFNITYLYNPPHNKPNLECLSQNWNNRSIILGDFNAHSIRWGYNRNCPTGNIVEDFIDMGPVQYIPNYYREPTFLSYGGSSSSPDLLLAHTNLVPDIHHVLLSSPGGAGHKILSAKVTSSRFIYNEIKQTRWNLRKADWIKYRQITDKLLPKCTMDGSVDKVLDSIMFTILECAQVCIPRGQVKGYKPFWNAKLQGLRRERDVARKQAVSSGLLEDCVNLREKHAVLKREIIEAKRTSYSNFLESLDFRRDGMKAHQFLSRLNRQTEKRNQPLIIDGKSLTSENDIAKAFNKYYCGVSNFHPLKRLVRRDLELPSTCLTEDMDRIFNSPFSPSEFGTAMSRLTKGKCAGPDEILPEFLTYLGPKSKHTLLELLNKTWGGHLPSIWRKAEVIPILKNGKNPNDVSGFRPISLTCILCKLIERMVVDRLQHYLEADQGLSERQAGFRKNRSTVEQITRLSQQVKDGFQVKQSTLAVFVDFKSAFDRVWRNMLLKKLIKLGVSGCLYKWIRSFLSQRFIRVRYGGAKSSYRQTKQGLPQGSVLSPCLFNVMIDDLIEKIISGVPGVQVLLYADDLVMWATGSNIDALEESLNTALNVLANWAKENEMIVNPEKTTCQLFSLSTKKYSVDLKYEDKPILRTDVSTYLGIALDCKLNWNKQVDKINKSALKRMSLLKRLSGIRWGATQDVLAKAYKSYVRPVMDYGGEVLVTASKSTLDRLDITQNCALRLITGAACSTPIQSMELQVGIEPLTDRRERAALVLREKLLRGGGHFWATYRPARSRLKTQLTFLSRTNEIYVRLNMPDIKRQPFLTNYSTMQKKTARAKFDLILPCSKKQSSDVELKSLTLATIYERYPSHEWLHVYTDGSADAATKNAGAGVFCEFFQLQKAVGAHCDNFDAEISAVLLATEAIKSRTEGKVVFFIDSQAAIQALIDVNNSSSITEEQCKSVISHLIDSGKEIIFQWIPSHCGVPGNESADGLAKSASQMPQPDPPLPIRNCRNIIRNRFREERQLKYEEQVKDKDWGCLINKTGRISTSLPRRVGVACFRILTGHDYLQQHLHRIGVMTTATCPLCGQEEMNGQHLPRCIELQDINSGDLSPFDISHLYWTARHRMAEGSRMGVG